MSVPETFPTSYCITEVTILLPERLWSNVASEYRTVSLRPVTVPLHKIFTADCDLNRGLLPNKIDSVVPKSNNKSAAISSLKQY